MGRFADAWAVLRGRRPAAAGGGRPRMHVPIELARWFDMGKSGRLTAGWTTVSASINSEIYHALDAMRARSRDLWANNEHAKRWIELAKQNVIGPGITLRMDVRNPDGSRDRDANAVIEAAWRDWYKRGHFDVTTKLEGVDGENLFLETSARDGEALARIRVGPDINAWGFGVQFVDAERLDIRRNRTAPDRVVMGVGLSALNRPETYHLLTGHPNGLQTDPTMRHETVDAGELVHGFAMWRPEQVRGVPWAHAASIALWDLGGYREAAVVAARLGASKLGWWRTPTGDDGPYDGVDASGNKITTAEPGEFGQVGPDAELVEWDPEYPHAQFDAFHAAMLRGVSAALGPAYHNLSGDLSSTSFSSGRLGRLSEIDHYMAQQRYVIGAYLTPIFPVWLRYAMLTGRVPIPLSQFDRVNRPTWEGRRWEHVQPREEASAASIWYGLRAKSLSRIMRERGIDPDREFEQMAADNERMRELGIEPTLPSNVQVDGDSEDGDPEAASPTDRKWGPFAA